MSLVPLLRWVVAALLIALFAGSAAAHRAGDHAPARSPGSAAVASTNGPADRAFVSSARAFEAAPDAHGIAGAKAHCAGAESGCCDSSCCTGSGVIAVAPGAGPVLAAARLAIPLAPAPADAAPGTDHRPPRA